LKKRREELGLFGEVSAGTVTKHMKALARLCEVEALTTPDDKRQKAFLVPGLRATLKERRPWLLDIIRQHAGPEAPRAVAFPALDIPVPSVIIAGVKYNVGKGSPQ